MLYNCLNARVYPWQTNPQPSDFILDSPRCPLCSSASTLSSLWRYDHSPARDQASRELHSLVLVWLHCIIKSVWPSLYHVLMDFDQQRVACHPCCCLCGSGRHILELLRRPYRLCQHRRFASASGRGRQQKASALACWDVFL